jgi:hypothetical protein
MRRRALQWESNLQGAAGLGLLLFLSFAFVMMALASSGH